MGRKKPFIAPGEGVKFYLVNRSQKDPLYLDESLGENVLVPADDNVNEDLVRQINGLHLQKPKINQSEKAALKEKRLKEQQKFGIYFEDDYNYLQHLKEADDIEEEDEKEADMIRVDNVLIKDEEAAEVKVKQGLRLPATVFASKFEEDVGYFNQAAPNSDPKIGWDPEIVRMLDEDAEVDFEDADNFLDDDFFVKANQTEPIKDRNLKNKSLNVDEEGDEYEEDDQDGFGSDEAENEFFDDYSESQSVREFETKSRFSEYSMSSSVIKRTSELKNLGRFFNSVGF